MHDFATEGEYLDHDPDAVELSGFDEVSIALDQASSRIADGEVSALLLVVVDADGEVGRYCVVEGDGQLVDLVDEAQRAVDAVLG